ncbi:hypothetical protein F5883DRAFT_129449 [Diaporthe sp. PMI_573]|nr:hypothetical protein F5883DRAFT_129449 [Diaporthaceae sp. PMI_573]
MLAMLLAFCLPMPSIPAERRVGCQTVAHCSLRLHAGAARCTFAQSSMGLQRGPEREARRSGGGSASATLAHIQPPQDPSRASSHWKRT